MKLTSLGCWGAYPQANSANSAFLLEEDGFHMLIDCGSGVLSQLQRSIPIERLDALILSHYHHDHVADVGCLQYAMMVQQQLGTRTRPLTIYGHTEDAVFYQQLQYKQFVRSHPISAEQRIQIGPWDVSFCPTEHGAYCLAMKFIGTDHTLVYTGDTGWSDELVRFASGADTLISEASFYEEQKGQVFGHMTAGEAGELASKADVKQLILTHFPHYGDHNQLQKQASKSFEGIVELAQLQKQWSLSIE